MKLRTFGRHLAQREEGVALAMVLGVGAVMLLLVATLAAGSVSGAQKAVGDEDRDAAIAAAYAGIGDYQGRLANDYTYVQYGNPAALFGKTNPNRAVSLPPTQNDAFGVGTTGTWASVAGSSNGSSNNAYYRYEVDNSDYSQTGVLRLRSTGRVGNTTRTVIADLKQQGFIDFLYFTDYEIPDPDLSGNRCTVDHAWALSSPRPTSCTIEFVAADEIDGPLHSNDTMVICGGTFDGIVTSSSTTVNGSKRYSTSGCSSPSAPRFLQQPITAANPTVPAYAKTIGMPASNSKLVQEARTDLPLSVQRPGCIYTGPTTVTFNGANMTIRSPWTKKTQISGDPATSGSSPAMCGTPGDPTKSESQNANTLAGANGVTIPVLDHNLIYVQSVPRTSNSDPNYWANTAYPNRKSRGTQCIGLSGSSGAGNGLGYPMNNEVAPAATPSGDSYGCDVGDVFVQGTFDAAMTIAASHYVYVTGNIKRQDTQTDILGLIGTGAVQVWNPVNYWGNKLLNDNGRQIDAAILSVAHSFQVQNFSKGGYRGDLTVNGAIAQKFRGVVGTGNGSTGYTKQYVYDPRLHNIAPPKFLSPVSTTYGVNVLVEAKTAYKPDGTAIP